jgi:transmembrane sensor
MNKQSNTISREAIAEEAAKWFVDLRSGSLDRQSLAAFMAWLTSSPVHIEQYLAIAEVARDVARAARVSTTNVEQLLKVAESETQNVIPISLSAQYQGTRAVTRSRGLTWGLAAALLLVFACSVIWWNRDGERFGFSITYRTAQAEQRVVPLPDGSILHLDTDSAVTVRYTRQERIVQVDRGQAFFNVVHETSRDFKVTAGRAEALAVGTAFDVYRKSGAVFITVLEGSVKIDTAPVRNHSDLVPRQSVRLDEGYQVEVGEYVGSPKRVDARATISWLQRRISFEDETLGEVAAEFNRYGRVQIQVDDDVVRALKISGEFDAYDTDSFASFLETINDVRVQRTASRIYVRSASTHRR